MDVDVRIREVPLRDERVPWWPKALFVVVLVVAVVLGAGLVGRADADGPRQSAAAPALQAGSAQALLHQTLGCVVRFTSTGPRIHANVAHDCTLGTELRKLSNGRLQIVGTPDRPVVTLGCTPDESLVVRGVTCGPSGGTGQVTYQLAISGRAINVSDPRLVCTYCNLWLSGTYA